MGQPSGDAAAGRRSPEVPAGVLALLEARAALELGAFALAVPALELLPRGDGHPVLVLPGLAASDLSTRPLRWYLRTRGYHTHGWRLGRNLGPAGRVLERLSDRLAELSRRHGRRISIVGWSMGGIYARGLARDVPDAVRQVVTLGSPFRFLERTVRSGVALRDAVGDEDHSEELRGVAGRDLVHLRVPSTAVYSRTDGVVPWRACVDRPGPQRENVEVYGSHVGLGHNPSVLVVVANRLAQPEGEWRPFRPPAVLTGLYPKREGGAAGGPADRGATNPPGGGRRT